jgi:hypothetical protein
MAVAARAAERLRVTDRFVAQDERHRETVIVPGLRFSELAPMLQSGFGADWLYLSSLDAVGQPAVEARSSSDSEPCSSRQPCSP